MEDRIWAAGVLCGWLGYLVILFLYSRRLPAPVACLGSLGLFVAGLLALEIFGPLSAFPSPVWAVLVWAVGGGLGGAGLCAIDCFRVEAWRRETPRAVVHAVGQGRREALRAWAEQIRSGCPIADCPSCGTRVLFGDDLRCPQCGQCVEG